AAANRPYVMAYLHLVLIGTITLPLLTWYLERGLFWHLARIALVIVVVGFFFTEVLLTIMPQASRLSLGSGSVLPMAMLVASVILTLGIILLLFLSWKADKS